MNGVALKFTPARPGAGLIAAAAGEKLPSLGRQDFAGFGRYLPGGVPGVNRLH